MMKLKKILPDSSKNRRSRRMVLNIQITFLGWLIEVFGFLSIAVGLYIVGHGNATVTLVLQTFSMTLYGILLPCSVLINSSEVKDYIAESDWYPRFIAWIGCQPVVYSTQEDDNVENADQGSQQIERDVIVNERNSGGEIENEQNEQQEIENMNGKSHKKDEDNLPSKRTGRNPQDLKIEEIETTNSD